MAEIDQDKIDAVISFLKKEFPECSISTTKSFDYRGQSFTIICGDVLYLSTINKSFFETRSTNKICSWLRNSNLIKTLLRKPNHRIVIKLKGQIEDYGEV